MHSIKCNINGAGDMQTSQNTAIVKKKINVFVEIENEFIQILIKIHLVMCLALNKRSVYKRKKKKEEESKTIRRSGTALKKYYEICQFV